MRLDVVLRLLLELHIIPVIIQSNDSVDRVAELRYQQQQVDDVNQVLVAGINTPIAIEDRMANPAVAIDVGMINRRYKTSSRCEHGILGTHLNVQQECATGIRALRRS
jgi:hypothetical protein